MTISKTQALETFASHDPAFLRPMFARLARLTPDATYFSSDMPSYDGTLPDTNPSLSLIAAAGLEKLSPGDELKCEFGGLYSDEGGYGDWTVTLSYARVEAGWDVHLDRLEQDLAALPPEDLRPILSEGIDAAPKTLVSGENFDFMTPKKIDDGNELDALGQGAMFICSAMQDIMHPGETRTVSYFALPLGGEDVYEWTIEIHRETQCEDAA